MAPRFNPALGDVRVTDADGGEWTLRYDVNALCAAEDKLGAAVSELARRLEAEPSMRDLRAMLWAGLQAHHPEVDEAHAGRLLAPNDMADAIGRALGAAFPDAAPADRANPPAAGGDGPSSSPRGPRPGSSPAPSGA